METTHIKSKALSDYKINRLQSLIDYLNETFEKEHECNFHPFVLKNNKVTGIFGIAHISSEFFPIHSLYGARLIEGYIAQSIASTHETQPFKAARVNKLLKKTLNKPAQVRSIVTFDRLCRIVNLLNYLTLPSNDNFLISEVNPGYILSIPYNHGVYFADIIIRANLKLENIVISMTTVGIHQEHYPQLLKGLSNYRMLGYKIALNMGHLSLTDKKISFLNQLAPDYVIVDSPNVNQSMLNFNSSLVDTFRYLKKLTISSGGKMILKNVKSPEQSVFASQIGFNLVMGDCYENSSEFQGLVINNKHDISSHIYSG